MLNEKQTSWISGEPDGLFDIKKSPWHFKKAVPEWFPRNFRKAWYKAHRYLSNIHSNLLFYLQTETYVSRPLHPPPPISPYYHTDLLLQDFSHSIFLFFPPVSQHLSIFIIFSHHSLSISQTLAFHTCPTFTFSFCFFPRVSVCDADFASGRTESSHLKHFRETHICCFRAQRDMPWQRLFEVASQGEPEPERGIWETIRKRKRNVTLVRPSNLMEVGIDSMWRWTTLKLALLMFLMQ